MVFLTAAVVGYGWSQVAVVLVIVICDHYFGYVTDYLVICDQVWVVDRIGVVCFGICDQLCGST